ncbi:hypothetical protein V7023_28535, partial [Priestia megaterium]
STHTLCSKDTSSLFRNHVFYIVVFRENLCLPFLFLIIKCTPDRHNPTAIPTVKFVNTVNRKVVSKTNE